MGDQVSSEKGDHKACPRCGEQIQDSARVCRYCGKKFGPHYGRWIVGAIALVVIAGVVAAWFNGSFDQVLYKVSLNHEDCAENAFGKALCGDDLRSFCHERPADVEVNACDELGIRSDAAIAERQQEEQEKKESRFEAEQESELFKEVEQSIAAGERRHRQACKDGGVVVSTGSLTLAEVRDRYEESISMQGLFADPRNEELRQFEEDADHAYLGVPISAGTEVFLSC